MKTPRILQLPRIGEAALGYISVLERKDPYLPFEVKRVYWTYFTPNHVERGQHAHLQLEQIIVAVSGIIDFTLIDRAGNRRDYTLDTPDKGLYIPGGYWREIRFSHNAVLLCLASAVYDEKDYIRDFNEFIKSGNP